MELMSGNGWHKEEQIIESLIRSSNVSEASALCNVSTRTIRRYLANPEFRKKLQDAKAELLQDAIDELRRNAKGFASVLVEVAHSEIAPPSAKVAACKAGLSIVIDAHSLEDVMRRIAELERKTVNQTPEWKA
jgi:DeoR/GlpR family transcriptional regulator of sugar metabolism